MSVVVRCFYIDSFKIDDVINSALPLVQFSQSVQGACGDLFFFKIIFWLFMQISIGMSSDKAPKQMNGTMAMVYTGSCFAMK